MKDLHLNTILNKNDGTYFYNKNKISHKITWNWNDYDVYIQLDRILVIKISVDENKIYFYDAEYYKNDDDFNRAKIRLFSLIEKHLSKSVSNSSYIIVRINYL